MSTMRVPCFPSGAQGKIFYKSKESGFKRKSYIPMVVMPASFLFTNISWPRTIIFLNENYYFFKGVINSA